MCEKKKESLRIMHRIPASGSSYTARRITISLPPEGRDGLQKEEISRHWLNFQHSIHISLNMHRSVA